MEEITNLQFNRFLRAKAPEKPCPECGINSWSTAANGDMPDAPIEKLFIPFGGGDQATAVAALLCKNCGYIKLFYRHTISKWIEVNG